MARAKKRGQLQKLPPKRGPKAIAIREGEEEPEDTSPILAMICNRCGETQWVTESTLTYDQKENLNRARERTGSVDVDEFLGPMCTSCTKIIKLSSADAARDRLQKHIKVHDKQQELPICRTCGFASCCCAYCEVCGSSYAEVVGCSCASTFTKVVETPDKFTPGQRKVIDGRW